MFKINALWPISLTSLVSKILEQRIRDEFMLRCHILDDHRQHGFMQGKSCGTQLVGFSDSIALSLNENIRSDIVYFYFAKALIL